MRISAGRLLLGGASSLLVAAAMACSSTDTGASADPTTTTTGGDAAIGEDGNGGGGDDASSSTDGSSGNGDPDGGTDAPTDSPADAPITPPMPAVRYVGRFDTSNANGPRLAWSAGRVIVRFDGTALTVKLTEVANPDPDYGPSRYDVIIDGTVQASPLVPSNGAGDYAVATGLPAGIHTVELYRRNEAQVGVTQFRGFELPNGGVLLAPDPAPNRRIEFIGDSTTNGYGNLCTDPNVNYTGATQNARLAFPGLASKDLGADHLNIAYSGKGVIRNYNYLADTVVFPTLYPRTLPGDATSTWGFTSFVPHVVWITLGGNDWDIPPNSPPPVNLTTFTTKYGELVDFVRSKYPTAEIFMAIAPSLNDDYPVGYNALSSMKTALANVKAARTTDTRLNVHEFARAGGAQLTGCDYHANAALHRTMADEVVTAVQARMSGKW